jgi:DNA-binding response OmpR family regulator
MRVVLTVIDNSAPARLIAVLDKRAVSIDLATSMADSISILDQYACDALMIWAVPDTAKLAALVHKARQGNDRLPVLVYGVGSAANRVACFDAGADEVVGADCDANELVARLHAIVRRSKGHSSPNVSVGNLVLDISGASVRVNGQALQLTRKEFRILEMLVVSTGVCISKVKLMDALYFGRDERDEGIIGVFLCMLRKKLREAGAEVVIETFRGIGYSLHPVAAGSGAAKRRATTTVTRRFAPAAAANVEHRPGPG